MRRWRVAVGVTLLLTGVMVASACSSDKADRTDGPIFGTEDTACASTQLRNEDGDLEKLAVAIECFQAEFAAGRSVTVDIITPTTEGDAIYHRYAYDGDQLLIITDSRADEFGQGNVTARTCQGLRPGRWLPEEIGCSSASADGFPEAG